MDDLIYVLLGIAWVGYSIYTARQKALKKQQGEIPPVFTPDSSPLPIPGNTGKGRSLLEDILTELQGQQPPPVKVPADQQKSFTDSYQQYSTASDKNLPEEVKLSEIEYQKRHSLGTKKAGKSNEKDVQLPKDENFSQNFNLREAVIFSELLNRKYF